MSGYAMFDSIIPCARGTESMLAMPLFPVFNLTQPKFALKFFRKDFYVLILRETQTDQNIVFIFHDRHIFLALLVK